MNYLEATQFLALTMIENYLHIQYIGDIRMILRKLRNGLTMKDGMLVHDQEMEKVDLGTDQSGVSATARVLTHIFDEVTHGILFTTGIVILLEYKFLILEMTSSDKLLLINAIMNFLIISSINLMVVESMFK